MSNRKTYTERRSYSARVMRWRLAVYAERDGMTNGCRVLLLRLSDDMDAVCKVSVPRSVLAADLGVATPRVTEWVGKAKALGFLDTVRRGQPGVTAVYQGTIPSAAADEHGTPQRTKQDGSELVQHGTPEPTKPEVRPGVPSSESTWYALGGCQEVVATEANDKATATTDSNGALEESGSRAPLSLQGHAWVAQDCPHGIPETCTECALTTDRASTSRRLA